jgi:hypothetical protein
VSEKYRKDGWPLCPQCGEDELWDPLSWERPADATARLKCYSCDFDGRVPEKPRDQHKPICEFDK